jgi:Rieske Fe-S protein
MTLAVGNVNDVPLGGAVMHMTPETNLFVCRDADGYYAVDAGCTHLGCDVMLASATELARGFVCPCHGATYDANGQHPTAPAPTALPHYALCAESSGTLLVDVDQVVDPKTRLKP